MKILFVASTLLLSFSIMWVVFDVARHIGYCSLDAESLKAAKNLKTNRGTYAIPGMDIWPLFAVPFFFTFDVMYVLSVFA